MFRAPCAAEAECLDYEDQSINSDNDQIQQNLNHLCEIQMYAHTPYYKQLICSVKFLPKVCNLHGC